MSKVLSDDGLDLLFRDARTHNVWRDEPVDDALLRRVYDLAKLGPTSANMCPLRVVFVKSKAAKEKLRPALDAANVDKTMAAPVTAVLGMDVRFYELLPKLFPHADAKAWFKDLPENILEYLALRNSSLQGAYFMLAARALGLDCGPMSGFNPEQALPALAAAHLRRGVPGGLRVVGPSCQRRPAGRGAGASAKSQSKSAKSARARSASSSASFSTWARSAWPLTNACRSSTTARRP
jgi:3-hydroxypropanoate dehydrogenase